MFLLWLIDELFNLYNTGPESELEPEPEPEPELAEPERSGSLHA